AALDALQASADKATRRAEAVASLAALEAALERGGSPSEAAARLQGAGVELPQALARELPTLDQIQAGFDPAARAALRASLRSGAADDGALGVVSNFLRVQSGARSVEP